MKAISIFLLIFIVKITSFGQTTPFELTFIYEVEGDKEFLFEKTLQWLPRTFIQKSKGIQYKSKDDGVIISDEHLVSRFNAITGDLPIYFTITVNIKDSKIRYVLNNFYYYLDDIFDGRTNKIMYLKEKKELPKKLIPKIEELMLSYVPFVKNSISNDNW